MITCTSALHVDARRPTQMSRFRSILPPSQSHVSSDVTRALEQFANLIGYAGSEFRDAFIERLNKAHSFLHKFHGFSRTSKFWQENSQALIERDKKIRSSLNREVILRRNPKLRSYTATHILVTDLSSYVFCPASAAVKMTYDTVKSDEIYKSEELRDGKFLEEFLVALRRKRSIDFVLSKMNITKDKLWNIEIEELSKDHKVYLHVKGSEPYVRTAIKEYDVHASSEEYLSFINRGDYGEILQSKITFRGHQHDLSEPFFNQEKTLSGIPDYILENSEGKRFLLLEKHTWREEAVSHPYPNHIVQALGYLLGLPSLHLQHGYILYLQNRRGARLFKVTLDGSAKQKLRAIFHEVQTFEEKKSIPFNTDSINLDKCFRCSVRMYCYHKAGQLSMLELPYNTKHGGGA